MSLVEFHSMAGLDLVQRFAEESLVMHYSLNVSLQVLSKNFADVTSKRHNNPVLETSKRTESRQYVHRHLRRDGPEAYAARMGAEFGARMNGSAIGRPSGVRVAWILYLMGPREDT